jgi:hypothetical protein
MSSSSTTVIMLPISRGLLEHKERMGSAIWEFLWFVDKVTEDVPDGTGKSHGLVLGGHPVSLAQIAGDLKEHVDTAKRNVKALELGGYIVRRRLPENRCAYVVANSRKWLWRDRRQGINALTHRGENAPTDVDARAKMHPAQGQECTHREGENALANKETLQNLTKNNTKPSTHRGASGNDSLPDWMPKENWQGFVDHRRRMRAPLTPRAIQLIVDQLSSLRERGQPPEAVLDQSVINGWRGIFELKGTNGNGNGNLAGPKRKIVNAVDVTLKLEAEEAAWQEGKRRERDTARQLAAGGGTA